MPYYLDSPLAAAGAMFAGMARAKEQQRQLEQQRLDNEYRQAQIEDMRVNEARTRQQDELTKRKSGAAVSFPQQLLPKAGSDPMQIATSYLAIADYYDRQGASDAAKEYRSQAAAIMAAQYNQARTDYTQAGVPLRGAQTDYTRAGVPLRKAQTNLTNAKTTTEQERPDLIKAQIKNILEIHPSLVQEQIESTNNRAMAAIAAALSRQQQREDYQDRRDQHKEAHSDNQSLVKGQEQTLRKKIDAVRKARPGISDDELRIAALNDGYPEAVVNRIFHRSAAERNFKKTTKKGTSYGWGSP